MTLITLISLISKKRGFWFLALGIPALVPHEPGHSLTTCLPGFWETPKLLASRQLLLLGKISNTNLHHSALPSTRSSGRVLGWLRLIGRLFRPHSINPSAEGGDSGVVAEENTAGLKGIVRPRVVHETATGIGGARQDDRLPSILRISPAIVKHNIDGAIAGIHCRPLEKLVGAIVDGIAVHAYRLAPRLTVVR